MWNKHTVDHKGLDDPTTLVSSSGHFGLGNAATEYAPTYSTPKDLMSLDISLNGVVYGWQSLRE